MRKALSAPESTLIDRFSDNENKPLQKGGLYGLAFHRVKKSGQLRMSTPLFLLFSIIAAAAFWQQPHDTVHCAAGILQLQYNTRRGRCQANFPRPTAAFFLCIMQNGRRLCGPRPFFYVYDPVRRPCAQPFCSASTAGGSGGVKGSARRSSSRRASLTSGMEGAAMERLRAPSCT